jgi:hypothetical protein
MPIGCYLQSAVSDSIDRNREVHIETSPVGAAAAGLYAPWRRDSSPTPGYLPPDIVAFFMV